MPIQPPSLDDRDFTDLVDEVLARVPAHTPEWTNPRIGDPGRTLVELFAWLTDTLLYRANLIPERQRLAFLRLLGMPMRPAVAAHGLVTLAIDDDKATEAVSLRARARVSGPVTFETRREMTVLPVTAEAYYKRRPTPAETPDLDRLLPDLRQVYSLKPTDVAVPYVTTAVFAGGAPAAQGFDVAIDAVDKALWLALLAAKPELVDPVRMTLGGAGGRQRILNVGVMPLIDVPPLLEDIGTRARVPHVFEITGPDTTAGVEYVALDLVEDSTRGLTQSGVLRLVLPPAASIGAPQNDVRTALDAGVGDRPPRLDDPVRAGRLVAWLRLRPTQVLHSLPLSWIGINAVEIDQRETIEGRVIRASDGTADQEFELGATSVETETLDIQVEETRRGYQSWLRLDDLALAGRDDAVYTLDSEAGTIRFGDGVRGRIPEAGRRVRIGLMRVGGGRAGNLPAGALAEVAATDLAGNSVPTLKVTQSLATTDGDDPETLDEAERRIPARLRHRDRAVTADDYQRIAEETPGVRIGRVEVLPRFKPQQRRSPVPGVVSVMVLPFAAERQPPNPRADRPFLETVHAYLDARRPIATELYAIGCEYVPLGLSVGITIRDGFGRDTVIQAVRDALRLVLWPLVPGGPTGRGWPLGRTVRDRELEVTVARVDGVDTVSPINLFERRGTDWRLVPRPDANHPVDLVLREWQLPELLSLVVLADAESPKDLRGVPNPFAQVGNEVAIPVVPEVC